MLLSEIKPSFGISKQAAIAPLLFAKQPNASHVAPVSKAVGWHTIMEGVGLPAPVPAVGKALKLKTFCHVGAKRATYAFEDAAVLEESDYIKKLLLWGLRWELLDKKQVQAFLVAPQGMNAQVDAFNEVGSQLLLSIGQKIEEQQKKIFAAGDRAEVTVSSEYQAWCEENFSLEVTLNKENWHGSYSTDLILRLEHDMNLAVMDCPITTFPVTVAKLYRALLCVGADLSHSSTIDGQIEYSLDCWEIGEYVNQMSQYEIENLTNLKEGEAEVFIRDNHPSLCEFLDDDYGEFGNWYGELSRAVELKKYLNSNWMQAPCEEKVWRRMDAADKLQTIQSEINSLANNRNPLWLHPAVEKLKSILEVAIGHLDVLNENSHFVESSDASVWESRIVSYGNICGEVDDILNDVHQRCMETGEVGSIGINLDASNPFGFVNNILLGEWIILAVQNLTLEN